MTTPEKQERIPNGAAAAAILAAGIGCLALAVFVVLAEASAGFRDGIRFYMPAGPLSGKTTLTVLVWIVAWAVLHYRWRQKDVDFSKVFTTSTVLVGLGVVGTFPKFFDLFAGG